MFEQNPWRDPPSIVPALFALFLLVLICSIGVLATAFGARIMLFEDPAEPDIPCECRCELEEI